MVGVGVADSISVGVADSRDVMMAVSVAGGVAVGVAVCRGRIAAGGAAEGVTVAAAERAGVSSVSDRKSTAIVFPAVGVLSTGVPGAAAAGSAPCGVSDRRTAMQAAPIRANAATVRACSHRRCVKCTLHLAMLHPIGCFVVSNIQTLRRRKDCQTVMGMLGLVAFWARNLWRQH